MSFTISRSRWLVRTCVLAVLCHTSIGFAALAPCAFMAGLGAMSGWFVGDGPTILSPLPNNQTKNFLLLKCKSNALDYLRKVEKRDVGGKFCTLVQNVFPRAYTEGAVTGCGLLENVSSEDLYYFLTHEKTTQYIENHWYKWLDSAYNANEAEIRSVMQMRQSPPSLDASMSTSDPTARSEADAKTASSGRSTDPLPAEENPLTKLQAKKKALTDLFSTFTQPKNNYTTIYRDPSQPYRFDDFTTRIFKFSLLPTLGAVTYGTYIGLSRYTTPDQCSSSPLFMALASAGCLAGARIFTTWCRRTGLFASTKQELTSDHLRSLETTRYKIKAMANGISAATLVLAGAYHLLKAEHLFRR